MTAGASLTLGVVADDFTGATDVASMLVRGGLRTVQVIGVPEGEPPAGVDAVVVALKSRTIEPDQAVRQSVAAWRWLAAAGARRAYFKVCSTFDSTPRGNIGPVTEALMAELGARQVVVCPAFPENGRTVFRGHLFVGDTLLSESGMREHPLTPMTDANLVRVMQAQSSMPVGLLRYDAIARGVEAARDRLRELEQTGARIVVADALHDGDLITLAMACDELPLFTAGSGLALGLPRIYAERGWVRLDPDAGRLGSMAGHAAVIAGSCSTATNAQVERWREQGRPAHALDPRALADDASLPDRVVAWALSRGADSPVLVHATMPPAQLREVQAALGAEHAGRLVETALARIAHALVDAGLRRLVVAGGETSGAVVQALGVKSLRIGPPICPGVPWTQAEGRPPDRPLWLALKSGNFGGPAFFAEALAMDGRSGA